MTEESVEMEDGSEALQVVATLIDQMPPPYYPRRVQVHSTSPSPCLALSSRRLP